MCRVDDADPVDVHVCKDVRAAKDHRCTECRGPIHKGETYQRHKVLSDDHWWTERVCMPCVQEACGWLMSNCGGYIFGQVREELEEHLSDNEIDDPEERSACFWALVNMRRRARTT